jgi:hypothetical protein
MIQIDDSGWGSLLGGVYIGVYNTKSGKMFSKLIPVSYFQEDKFEKKKYLEKALNIAREGILKVGSYNLQENEIQCCRGYALETIRKWLSENKNTFKSVKFLGITDPIQSELESKFSKHLGSIGVPLGSGSGAHRISFEEMLKWVADDNRRVKYVKTGWKSWKEKYSKSCE